MDKNLGGGRVITVKSVTITKESVGRRVSAYETEYEEVFCVTAVVELRDTFKGTVFVRENSVSIPAKTFVEFGALYNVVEKFVKEGAE
jgi:hypothetical protein